MIASFREYMQHTDEHHSCVSSREPTHCTKAMRFGTFPSEGRTTLPQGPLAERRRSNWRLDSTFGARP